MQDVVTLGEIMLRLSTPGYQKLEQAKAFDVVYGGGEANVAISLAQLGLHSSFISKLPDDALGISAKQYLNQFGVNTEHLLFGGERIGIYFLEKGYSIRSSKVIYDRKYSSFSQSKLEEYDFPTIFSNAKWFHVSGITAALNDELYKITMEALKAAKEKGLTTSCDLNYRSSLWSFEDARVKMTKLMEYVDVCIGVEPLQLLDENGQDIKDQYKKPLTKDNYKEIMKKLVETFNFSHVAMTFREHLSVNRNRLSAMLYDGNDFYMSPEREVEFVDRVGAGDSFSAGLIYSLYEQYKPQDVINFASANFVLKHTIEGDANLLRLKDIKQFIEQQGSTTISR